MVSTSLNDCVDIYQNTDRAEVIRILSKLLEVSTTTYQKIRVLLALVAARLDYSQSLVSIPHDSWVSCMRELDALITLLLEEEHYIVEETVEEYDDMVDREPQMVNGTTQRVRVIGSLIGLLENLDNEVSPSLDSQSGSLPDDRLISSQKHYSIRMRTTKGPTTSSGFAKRFHYMLQLSRRKCSLRGRRGRIRLFELSCDAWSIFTPK